MFLEWQEHRRWLRPRRSRNKKYSVRSYIFFKRLDLMFFSFLLNSGPIIVKDTAIFSFRDFIFRPDYFFVLTVSQLELKPWYWYSCWRWGWWLMSILRVITQCNASVRCSFDITLTVEENTRDFKIMNYFIHIYLSIHFCPISFIRLFQNIGL